MRCRGGGTGSTPSVRCAPRSRTAAVLSDLPKWCPSARHPDELTCPFTPLVPLSVMSTSAVRGAVGFLPLSSFCFFFKLQSMYLPLKWWEVSFPRVALAGRKPLVFSTQRGVSRVWRPIWLWCFCVKRSRWFLAFGIRLFSNTINNLGNVSSATVECIKFRKDSLK